MDTDTKTPNVSSESIETAPASVEERKRRGFAVMAPALVRELARRGGKAAHEGGKAHEFTSEEARVAGRKGGAARAKRSSDGISPAQAATS